MCKLHRTRYHLCTHPLTTSFTPCSEIEASVDSPELCPNRTTSWTHDISTACPACLRDSIANRAGLNPLRKEPQYEASQTGLPSPRLMELKRRCSVRGRGSMREGAEREKRKSQLLTPPLSRSPTFMQTRHPRPPSPPVRKDELSKRKNGLLTPPLPETQTFLQPRPPPKPAPQSRSLRPRNHDLRAAEENEKAKRRTAIQIGCPSLGYTKVVVDDDEKEERRELSASEIIERRIAALRMLEGKRDSADGERGLGRRGEVLRAVAYGA